MRDRCAGRLSAEPLASVEFEAEIVEWRGPAPYLFVPVPDEHVALFTYDNGAFVIENYRDDAAKVAVSLAGSSTSVTDITQGAEATLSRGGARGTFSVEIPPHSFRAFKPH